jgi:hypothetical protein
MLWGELFLATEFCLGNIYLWRYGGLEQHCSRMSLTNRVRVWWWAPSLLSHPAFGKLRRGPLFYLKGRRSNSSHNWWAKQGRFVNKLFTLGFARSSVATWLGFGGKKKKKSGRTLLVRRVFKRVLLRALSSRYYYSVFEDDDDELLVTKPATESSSSNGQRCQCWSLQNRSDGAAATATAAWRRSSAASSPALLNSVITTAIQCADDDAVAATTTAAASEHALRRATRLLRPAAVCLLSPSS